MKQEHKYQYSKYLLYVVLITLLGVSFFAFYPFKVYEQHYDKLPVFNANHEVMPGEKLLYATDFCKYINKPAIVSKWIQNSELIYFSDVTSNAEIGCRESNVALLVPEYTTPGKAKLIVLIRYKVNLLQTREYKLETEDFIIK